MVTKGDMLEICVRCVNCGTAHACGADDCKHDFAFAIENASKGRVKAQFANEVKYVYTNDIVAYAWAGWVPEELEDHYYEWDLKNNPDSYRDDYDDSFYY